MARLGIAVGVKGVWKHPAAQRVKWRFFNSRADYSFSNGYSSLCQNVNGLARMTTSAGSGFRLSTFLVFTLGRGPATPSCSTFAASAMTQQPQFQCSEVRETITLTVAGNGLGTLKRASPWSSVFRVTGTEAPGGLSVKYWTVTVCFASGCRFFAFSTRTVSC